MTTEWIVAAVFVLVGLVAAVGFWWGDRDPIVRRYKPGSGGFFRIGRTLPRPEFDEVLGRNEKDANDGGSGRK
jgi:hypothetical protein